MGTQRKLEEIASDLDDLSVTLEEIKQTVQDEGTADQGRERHRARGGCD